jgi:hypothetical protein
MSPRVGWDRTTVVTLGAVAAAHVALLVLLQVIATWPAHAADGTWTPVASMPTAQQEVSYAEAGGRLYLVGWNSNVQRVYDPASNTWSTAAPLPAPQPLNHVQVAATGGKIFYVGGMLKWPTDSVGSVYVYDSATDSFTAGAPLPAGRDRGAGGIAAADGKLYLAGGVHDGTTVRWFDVYDPAANTWTSLPDMPHARNHFQGVVVGGRFWAIGGRTTASASNPAEWNEAFDLASGTWTAGFARLPTLRSGTAAAVFGSQVVVIGGEGGGGVFHEAEAYDTATDTWQALTPMPTARHGMQAAMWNGAAYVAGGGTRQGGGSATATQEVLTLSAIHRPDAQIRLASQTAFAGNDVYTTTGAGQTRSVTAARGTVRRFVVRVQNDGTVPDGFTVRGCSAAAGFGVRYLAGTSGTTDITSAVVAGSYPVPPVAPAGSATLRLVVTVGGAAARGAVLSCLVTATSTAEPTVADAVLARVTVS